MEVYLQGPKASGITPHIQEIIPFCMPSEEVGGYIYEMKKTVEKRVKQTVKP